MSDETDSEESPFSEEGFVSFLEQGLLENTLSRLREYAGKNVARRELGELSFPHANEILTRTLEVTETLVSIEDAHLYTKTLENLRKRIDTIAGLVFRAITYEPGEDTHDKKNHQHIQKTLGQQYEGLAREATSVLVMHPQTSNAQVEEIEELRAKARTLVVAMQDMAQGFALHSHVTTFEREATKHSIGVTVWGVIAAVMAICLGVVAHALWQDLPLTLATVVARAIILSIPMTVLVLCYRQVSSERRLAVLNRHRANALRSLTAMSESSKDPATKNFIIMKAAELIYTAKIDHVEEGIPAPSIPLMPDAIRALTAQSSKN